MPTDYRIKPKYSNSVDYWFVPSESTPDKVYDVCIVANNAYCTCPDFEQRCRANGLICKHIRAAQAMAEKVERENSVPPTKPEIQDWGKEIVQHIDNAITHSDNLEARIAQAKAMYKIAKLLEAIVQFKAGV